MASRIDRGDTLQTHVDDHDLKLPILADASGRMARDFDDLDAAGLVDQLLSQVRDLSVGPAVASATKE